MVARLFLYPIEYIEINCINENSEVGPYVAFGIFTGFLATGYLIKRYVFNLVRKHV
jgi:hypothetical protein